MRKRTIRRIEYVVHVVTALILLLKGAILLRQHLYFPGLILIGLAAVILIVLLLWKQLKISPKQARIACYYVESPALFLTSYMLFMEGREFQPYIFIIAGLMYPLVGFISSKKFKRMKKTL